MKGRLEGNEGAEKTRAKNMGVQRRREREKGGEDDEGERDEVCNQAEPVSFSFISHHCGNRPLPFSLFLSLSLSLSLCLERGNQRERARPREPAKQRERGRGTVTHTKLSEAL